MRLVTRVEVPEIISAESEIWRFSENMENISADQLYFCHISGP